MSRHIHACVNHTGFLKAVGLATTVLFMALIRALKLDQVLDGIEHQVYFVMVLELNQSTHS